MKKFGKRWKTVLIVVLVVLLLDIAVTYLGPKLGGLDGIGELFGGWTSSHASDTITLDSLPAFDGETAYVTVNGNVPFFDESDYTTEAFETYSELDSLGRCGVAYANICLELMPQDERESISQVKPSGWGHNNTYSCVEGGYIWNRCHLIGFQLAGENANKKNLITGTRYLNIDGMLDFENLVAEYVEQTGNHVLYRVTPIYEGSNLIADGVLMEGWSVEDNGAGVCYNVYAYNCQPGVVIDYQTGDNWEDTTSSQGSGTQDAEVDDGGFFSWLD